MSRLPIPRRRKQQSTLKKLLGYFAFARLAKTALTAVLGARRASVVGGLAVPVAIIGAIAAKRAKSKSAAEVAPAPTWTPPVSASPTATDQAEEEAAGGPPNESAQAVDLAEAAKNN